MFILEADLFKGLSQEVIKEIDRITFEESYEEGTSLFKEGDPASNFYILAAGKVKLTIGEEGYLTHLVNNPGEAFGWSSLVEHGFYTASAECSVPTKLLRIGKKDLIDLDFDPPDAAEEVVIYFSTIEGSLFVQAII